MHPVSPWFLDLCRPGVRALARVLFRIRFFGVEHVPPSGPVVLAPNPVSFMDPVLITIPIRRPLHYMTLESFFHVRGLGPLIRWCRAFPVRDADVDRRAVRTALRILHAGDTALYGDMKLFGQRYKPDVAMLPIGDWFTMGPEDAAEAASLWGVKTVIPMHYGTFPLLTGTVDDFKKALTPQIKLLAPAPGDTVEF